MTLERGLKYCGVALLLLMLTGVLAVAVSEVHSFDVFWQLQSGRFMWETGSFIRSDIFTLMKDVPRSEHTWLHSIILYFLYLLGGYGAISILKGVVITATLAVLIHTARIREASYAAIALVAPVFMLTSGGWLERPQIWTFLLFALFVWRLEVFSQTRKWNILWLLPASLFWINVHAGSVLAMAVLAAYLVGDLAEALLRQRRLPEKGFWRILVPAACIPIFGAVATPYPSQWFSTLFNSYDLGASVDAAGKTSGPATAVFNMDWTPTTFQQEPVFFYAMGVVGLIFLLGWRRIRLRDLCLMVGLSMMGLKLVRHIPFFYMGMLATCPAYLDAAVDPLRKRLLVPYKQLALIFLIGLAAGLFWFSYQPAYNSYGSFTTGLRSWHYPIAATEFVRKHQLPKNLYNTYDWGGYMAWQLYPDYLMFWDGRQNSAEMFQLGWNVMAGRPDWQQILDRFKVKTIVTRASTIDTGQKYPLLDRLRESPDWSLVFNAESSLVFVRNDSVPAAWLSRYARSKQRIDETILAEAHLMVKENANRYMAWWEMAQIYAQRKQYKNALFAVNQHLARSPQRSPAAVQMQQQLTIATQ